jgi:hypothetical protein
MDENQAQFIIKLLPCVARTMIDEGFTASQNKHISLAAGLPASVSLSSQAVIPGWRLTWSKVADETMLIIDIEET